MRNDVFVYYVKLPTRVKGFTVPCADGNYSVYINNALSDAQKEKTYRHELKHIERGDFDLKEYTPVTILEYETHA